MEGETPETRRITKFCTALVGEVGKLNKTGWGEGRFGEHKVGEGLASNPWNEEQDNRHKNR